MPGGAANAFSLHVSMHLPGSSMELLAINEWDYIEELCFAGFNLIRMAYVAFLLATSFCVAPGAKPTKSWKMTGEHHTLST